jgi:hypothetical protein
MLGMYTMEANRFHLCFPKAVCFQFVGRKWCPADLWKAIVYSCRVGSAFESQIDEFFDAGFLDRFQHAVEV